MLCLFVAAQIAVRAQTAGAGTIKGTVSDPKGLVAPQTNVLIHNVDTGADRSLFTNGAGIYTGTFLQPGHYEISASKPGFTTIIRKQLTLEVGETLTIDFPLTLASAASTVTVAGQAKLLDADKTEMSQDVSSNQIANLPIVGRRWDNFTLLTPGVTTDGALVSFHGISGLYNNNMVDGANNNQAFFSGVRGGSTVPYVYSLDSIQEFQVASNNYSAEFGQAAGGITNAITRSGTNTWHGDLFYYLRYPSLNALDPVNRLNGINSQTTHQQQQFGGSTGGPIIKNKLFFFVTYDGSRKVYPLTFTSTAAFPLPCPAAVSALQCTAANHYLGSLIGAVPRTAVQDVAFGKLDYELNSRNHLSANFDFDDFHAPNAFTAANSNGATVSNSSVTATGPSVTHTRFFVTNWDHTFTSNLINNLRYQWAVDNESTGVNSGGPSVSIANVSGYGLPSQLLRSKFPNETRNQITDTLSYTYGRHQFKMGVDVNLIHEVIVNLFQGGGVYSYTGSANTAFASWVLDTYGINTGDGKTGKHYTSFTQAYDPITGVGKDDFYNNDYAGFIEDSWRLRSNLTLNLGLRYDIQVTTQPPIPNTGTPLLTALTSKINTDSNNFGPRIGLAWQPISKTVVRLGYGMFICQDFKQRTVRPPRGKWHLPAAVQLRTHHILRSYFSQRDLHAAWTYANCSVHGSISAPGDQHESASGNSCHAWIGAGFRKSPGT